MLRLQFFVDVLELFFHAIDLLARAFALPGIQFRYARAGQAPMGAVQDRGRHFQIAQQFGGGAGGSFGFLPLRLEKQLGLSQDAFADRSRALAPGSIQLAGFARIRVVLGEDRGHPLAVLQALARHRRQKLHGHLRRDLALTHLLLDRLRQNLHQRQSPGYPTHTAVEPAR